MSWIVIEHDGVRHRLAVKRTPQGVWVGWSGGSTLIAKQTHQAGSIAADNEVRAPLTGKVLQVKVSPEDQVAQDDLLVIIEAMKMEYRLTAPRAGEVLQVYCQEGDLVEQGTKLVALSE
ncbi:MAG: acetyl-CoA carboxylase biotin carboxyl carrier protein subunit [Myxococcota bacterium]